jgi:hypothetical protein
MLPNAHQLYGMFMRVAVVALLVLNLFVIRYCVAGSSVHCKPGAQHNGSGAASPLISATPPGGAAPPPAAATPVKPPAAVTSSRVSLAVRAYESLNRNVVYGLVYVKIYGTYVLS